MTKQHVGNAGMITGGKIVKEVSLNSVALSRIPEQKQVVHQFGEFNA